MSEPHSWWRGRWVVGAIGLASIALMAANIGLLYVDRDVTLPEVSDHWAFRSVFEILVNVGVPVIGIVIASRRPGNPIGWLLLAAGLTLGLTGFSRAFALRILIATHGPLIVGRTFGWISNAIWPIPVAMLPSCSCCSPTATSGRRDGGGRRGSRLWCLSRS